jgi:hypothetical protein
VATPWDDAIKNGKVLTVFADANITSGVWSKIFPSAISEFNRLSQANSLGVTLQQGASPPDPSGVGGADVRVSAGGGSSLSGDTKLAITVLGATQRIGKAFITVPGTPKINTPTSNRDVGDGVKLVIMVHEFVHACGLTNADHSPDDLFFGFPQARVGKTPADDKIEVSGGKLLPPLFLSGKTVSVIQNNWT